MRTDGLKDMKKVIVAFRNFAKVPQNWQFVLSLSTQRFIHVSGKRNSFAGTPRSQSPIPGRSKGFFSSSKRSRLALEPIQPPVHWVIRPGREAAHPRHVPARLRFT